MKQSLFVILTTLIFQQALAQSDILFENITTKQGLSAAHVNQVIKDKKGFIWIATSDGLNRYDGVDFKVFKYDESNPNSISGNNIRCLLEDSDGNIWVGTLNHGLNKYDYQTGKFTRYVHQKKDKKSLSSNETLCLFEDSEKRIWVGTENGLNLFDAQNQTFTSFLPNENDVKSIQSKAILSIGEDSRGWIWIGTWDGGLNLAIPTNRKNKFEFRHFLKGDKPTDLKSNHIWKIFLDKENRLWLGTYAGGLSIMLPNKETNPKKFKPIFQTFLQEQPNRPIPNNLVFGLNQDNKGQIWAATVNGLGIFLPESRTINNKTEYILKNITHFQNDFFKPKSLIHNEMRDVFIDDAGLIWCSTLGGLSKYDPKSQRFRHFLQNQGKNIIVVSLLEYNDKIVYIGSRPELGLIEYYPQSNTYKSYYNPTDGVNGYYSEYISFYKAHSDTLWMGTRTGLVRFNPRTKQFITYPLKHPEGKELTNLHVRKIIRDKQKRFWLATGAGFVLFDEKKGTFQFFEKDSQQKTFANNDINDILLDDNTLWLATYGGLNRVQFRKDGRYYFKMYQNESNNPKSISSNRIKSLLLVNSELWIGTENGLSKYNEATDDFENITNKDGAKISSVISMVTTNDNRIWLGTRQGLIAFIPKKGETIYFDEKDGLQTGSFSLNAVSKSNNQIFMGGINGYIRFQSKDIQLNTTKPPVYITDVTIYNQKTQWAKDVTELKEITLKSSQNYFTIEYAALNYSQSSDNQYAYQLEGFNKDWVYVGDQKSVSFSNLNGGVYTFKVKGTNNDGTWNETPTILKIKVIPPLWRRGWFQLLILLAVVGLALYIYYRSLTRIERQKELLEVQVQIRTQELQIRNQEITTQKHEIERLVQELTTQNEQLEAIVEERTQTIEHANKELKRSNQALEHFAYAASHDLQEPLRMISSFITIFSKRYKSEVDERGQEYINYIQDGAVRMSALVKSLLTYSRVGRSDAKFTTIDLNRVLEKKIIDLTLKIKEKNAEVIIGDLPTEVYCEPEQIGIVFYNLINNGLKFNTKSNPKIVVKLENDTATHWIFSVSDNGIGIKKEAQDKIFEIFHRLHSQTEFEGNGIGLALCKRIILRHNGEIWLTSEPGEGTTFSFSIGKA